VRYGIPHITGELVGCLFLFLFAIHLLACGWYIVSLNISPTKAPGEVPPWVDLYEQKSGTSIERTATEDLYCLASYFGVMTLTTIGFGDVLMSTSGERWTSAVVVQLGSAAFYAYVIALATVLTTVARRNELQLESDADEVDDFGEDHGFGTELARRGKEFMTFSQGTWKMRRWQV